MRKLRRNLDPNRVAFALRNAAMPGFNNKFLNRSQRLGILARAMIGERNIIHADDGRLIYSPL